MNAMVMPTVVLIDKDRKVSWYHQGFIPGDENEIEAQILQLLNADRTKVGDKLIKSLFLEQYLPYMLNFLSQVILRQG